MSVFLGGGGSSAESVVLDRAFADAVGGGRLVNWPMAMAGHPAFDTCEAWLRNVFEPLGIHDIDGWVSFEGRNLDDLADAAGLYIGGGNTYRLLHELRAAGALAVLRVLVEEGLPVYGGSAGAAVLGADISTIAHLDVNEVGLTDLRAADVVGGRAVWVHYEETERAAVETWSSAHGGVEVIALATTAGAIFDGSTITSCGLTDAHVIRGR